jgi:predicted butyrate kinase (DUF1464 family)
MTTHDKPALAALIDPCSKWNVASTLRGCKARARARDVAHGAALVASTSA